MRRLAFSLLKRFRQDLRGQDLIEYALLAGFVAIAAGTAIPPMNAQFSTIFSKIQSTIAVASVGS